MLVEFSYSNFSWNLHTVTNLLAAGAQLHNSQQTAIMRSVDPLFILFIIHIHRQLPQLLPFGSTLSPQATWLSKLRSPVDYPTFLFFDIPGSVGAVGSISVSNRSAKSLSPAFSAD